MIEQPIQTILMRNQLLEDLVRFNIALEEKNINSSFIPEIVNSLFNPKFDPKEEFQILEKFVNNCKLKINEEEEEILENLVGKVINVLYLKEKYRNLITSPYKSIFNNFFLLKETLIEPTFKQCLLLSKVFHSEIDTAIYVRTLLFYRLLKNNNKEELANIIRWGADKLSQQDDPKGITEIKTWIDLYIFKNEKTDKPSNIQIALLTCIALYLIKSTPLEEIITRIQNK